MAAQRVGLTVLLALALLCGLAAAQIATAPPGIPQIFAQHRWIYCLLNVREINKLDGVEQSFYVNGGLTCYHQEGFLTGLIPPNIVVALDEQRVAQLRNLSVLYEPVFDNQRDIRQYNLLRMATLARPPALQGVTLPNPELPGVPWITYTVRLQGNFEASLAMRDFPFDTQTLYVNISSQTAAFIGQYSGQWKPGYSMVADVDEVIGWQIKRTSEHNHTFFSPEFGLALPRLTFAIDMERAPEYYMNKMVFGIVLITIMSLFTFLIEPRDTNRVMGAITAFMGVVTYLFVISTDVPKVAYLTRMDKFVNYSFYFIFGTFIIHLLFYLLVTRADAAMKRALLVHAQEKRKESSPVEPYPANPIAGSKAPEVIATEFARSNTLDVMAIEAMQQDDLPEGWWTAVHSWMRVGDGVLLFCGLVAYLAVSFTTLRRP